MTQDEEKEMDGSIVQSPLEFVIPESTDSSTVKSQLPDVAVPFPAQNLRAVILRRFQDEIGKGSVSEEMLEWLEILEELDRRDGIAVSESMKLAYCAVAVECSLKPKEEVVGAVDRIWKVSVGGLEGKSELITEKLSKIRDYMVSAMLLSEASCSAVLKWRWSKTHDALKSVEEFLKEAVASSAGKSAANEQPVLDEQEAETVDAEPNEPATCLEPDLGVVTANQDPVVETQTGKEAVNPEPGISEEKNNPVADVRPPNPYLKEAIECDDEDGGNKQNGEDILKSNDRDSEKIGEDPMHLPRSSAIEFNDEDGGNKQNGEDILKSNDRDFEKIGEDPMHLPRSSATIDIADVEGVDAVAPKDGMTEYERKRLENIRRNEERMAALKIQSKASELSKYATRSSRIPDTRRSLRLQRKQPVVDDGVSGVSSREIQKLSNHSSKKRKTDGNTSQSSIKKKKPKLSTHSSKRKEPKPSSPFLGPLSMTDVHASAGSHQMLLATLFSLDKRRQVSSPVKSGSAGGNVVKEETGAGVDLGIKEEKKENLSLLDLDSMKLETDNIATVVPGKIMHVKFLPCSDLRMVVVGNNSGNVGFWNMNLKGDDDHHNGVGLHLYRPHTAPIGAISFQESCFSKVITSCYDGYIRMMDVEKEAFYLVHHSKQKIYCLSRPPNNDKSLYFGEGWGGLTVWDEKMGKVSSQWFPHKQRINTIHFNPRNPNIMASASTDGTARIWDLRNVGSGPLKCLKIVNHNQSVHSAYFSPSGYSLATSSLDDYVRIQSGSNFEYDCMTMVPHDNQTDRWLSSFRAIWGWDDSYVFTANKKIGIDVISPVESSVVMTLKSPDMTATPCRFDAHPYQVGMLAGAASDGQVYVWTSS